MALSVLWKNFWIVLAVWDVECYEYQLEDTMQKKGLIPPPPHQLTSIANCHTYVVITKLIFVCIRTSTDRFDVTCLLNTGVTIRHSSLWKNFTPTPTEYKKNCWRPKKAQQRTQKYCTSTWYYYTTSLRMCMKPYRFMHINNWLFKNDRTTEESMARSA